MTVTFWLILFLPVILNFKGNLTLLVFFAMNSLLYGLMQYTKIQFGIVTSVAKFDSRMDELIDEGASFDEAFEEYMKNVNLEGDVTYVPKLIIFAANISLAICLIGIIVGIARLII